MDNKDSKTTVPEASNYSSYLNKSLIKNVVFFSGGIILFITGCIIYGVILNLREIPLNKAIAEKGFVKLKKPYIIIDRNSYALELFEDTVLIKAYRANFGRNVNLRKTKAGDLSTPVGDYKICEIDTDSRYYKFFKLNYPNLKDALEALRKNVISQIQFDSLKFELDNGECPSANTELGGGIGIQGIGRLDYLFRFLPFNYNWTDGSVAISNEDIDELYSVVKKGTLVVIK